MQIVIDIPQEVKQAFDRANNDDINFCFYDYNSVVGKAIKNGTVLPEKHGRLIDDKEIDSMFWDNRSKLHQYKDIRTTLDKAPTILEAREDGEE